MAIASISSSLPSVGGGNAAAAGGRLPDVESSRARENTASAKVAPPEPPRVFRTSVSLHPDDRIAGLNKIVAQVIDSQKKTVVAQVPPEWQIDLSLKLRALSAKIFSQ